MMVSRPSHYNRIGGAEDVKLLPALLNELQFRHILGEEFDHVDHNEDCVVACHTLQDPQVRVIRALRAASLGELDTLRHLGDVEVSTAKDSLGRGALCYAAYYGQTSAVSYLLNEMNVQPQKQRDSEGRGVLQYACDGGDVQVMELLLRGSCEIDFLGNSRASIASQPEDVADLFEGLILAARKGHIHVVTWLLGGDWGTTLLECLRNGSGATLLHLMGRKLGGQDLAHLRDCGLPLDVTSISRRGVPALQHLKPETLRDFLNLSVSPLPEHDNVTEGYKITNPFIHDNTSDLDLRTLLALSESIPHQHLIFHPVFTGICLIKWQYVRKWYYVILALFLMFAAVTSSIALFSVQNAYFSENPEIISTQLQYYKSQNFQWQIILCAILIILLACEILSINFSNPALNIVRYMVWIICILLVIILLTRPVAFIQENAFFICLVPWCMCTKHLGHHYLLARYYSNFIEITKTFIKVLCVFGSLIIACTLIFHVTILKYESSPFHYIHTSILKSITMMVGDLTIEEFKENYTDIQWFVTFFVFVIVLTILLYNMTNALAVSDTHRLESQADLYRVKSLARQILWTQSLLKCFFVPPVAEFSVECFLFDWIISNFVSTTFKNISNRAIMHPPETQDEAVQAKPLSLRINFQVIDQIRNIIIKD